MSASTRLKVAPAGFTSTTVSPGLRRPGLMTSLVLSVLPGEQCEERGQAMADRNDRRFMTRHSSLRDAMMLGDNGAPTVREWEQSNPPVAYAPGSVPSSQAFHPSIPVSTSTSGRYPRSRRAAEMSNQ